jgi:hypothetical protein
MLYTLLFCLVRFSFVAKRRDREKQRQREINRKKKKKKKKKFIQKEKEKEIHTKRKKKIESITLPYLRKKRKMILFERKIGKRKRCAAKRKRKRCIF